MNIAITGNKSNIVIREPETAQPQKVKCDNSAIEKLGYSPKVHLLDGVKKNIEFCKKHLYFD